ncbi:MAG: FtsQ-type POTRA domain-containing protein [Rhodospirillales bacterium]|nr:FtsQ-type POTRA domain-containing protein [Rhodospirillales bacterium]
MRAGLVTVALAALAVSGWWVWQTDLIERTVQKSMWMAISVTSKLGFEVGEIFVVGRHQTGRTELLSALRLKRGAPIFGFDPGAAQARMKSLPWVLSASIERHLPDVIHLRIVERRPLALWQREGVFRLIDTAGKVVEIDDVSRFGNLVVVIGKDAPDHAARLFDTLASQPEIFRRVKAAARIGNRRWDLYLANKMRIQLPEVSPMSALRKLAELQKRKNILNRDYSSIDLRLDDRIALRPPAGTGTIKLLSGRDT